jgi:hypothetical protein
MMVRRKPELFGPGGRGRLSEIGGLRVITHPLHAGEGILAATRMERN